MAHASVRKHQEVTLNVVSPILGTTPPNNTTELISQLCAGGSTWDVNLKRNWSTLEVSVIWDRNKSKDLTEYNWIYIVARSTHRAIVQVPIISNDLRCGFPVECEVEASLVTQGNAYVFDIVFTQLKGIARQPTIPSHKNQDLFSLLLKDVSSVDICFSFKLDDDGPTSHVGLWAHRVVLSRYEVFARLIQEEEMNHFLVHNFSSAAQEKEKDVNTESGSESALFEHGNISDGTATATSSTSCSSVCVESLVIKIDKISFTTMCALLDYLYTDKINLSFEFSRFAISITTTNEEESLNHHPGKGHHSVDWRSWDNKRAPWIVEDVTWGDLMVAANYYEILDLHAICQIHVVDGINKSTVANILFSSSGANPTVKKAALEFINNNLEAMFSQGKDPFEPYRDEPACYDYLVELTRLRLISP